jgi:hypothetical protein
MAGSTPIYAFPFPQPSDLVANYPALGEDLAEDVEDTIIATGGLQLINGPSGTNLSGLAEVVVNLTNKRLIHVWVNGASGAVGSWGPWIRFNADTGSNYFRESIGFLNTALFIGTGSSTRFSPTQIDAAGHSASIFLTAHGCQTAGPVAVSFTGVTSATATASVQATGHGLYNASAAITSVSVTSSSGNFDAGTFFVYAG